MKKTNKCSESKKAISKDSKKELNNNQIMHNKKKEKIIKDLKLKGYNEREITDIFEIFLSNSIDKEISEKVEEEKHQSINFNKNIIVAVKNNIKIKHKKFNYNSTNSRPNLSYKSTLLAKTENSEYKTNNNKNKSKINYLKVNINSSSEKYRLLKIKEKNGKKYINSNKRNNIPYNMRDIQRQNNINNEGLNCPKKFISDRNVKIKNNLKKYNSHSGNEIIINADKKNEASKKELLKKLGNEMQDINYKNINYQKMVANRSKIRLNKDKNKNVMKKNQDGNNINLKNKKIMTSKEKFRTADIKERTHSCSNKKTRKIKSHLNPESKAKENNNSFTNKEYKRHVKTQINSGTKKIKEIKVPKDILHVTKINDLKYRGMERVINEKKYKEINENKNQNANNNDNYNENDVIYVDVKNKNKTNYSNVEIKENHKINLVKQIKVNVKENIENKEINQMINSNIQDKDNIKEINNQNQNQDQNEYDVKENIKEINKEIKESIKIKDNYDIDEEKKNDIEFDNKKNNKNNKNKISDNKNIINDEIRIVKNKNKNNLKFDNISNNSIYDSLNKQMPLSTSRSNNIFIIRKQKNEEDDVIAKKNIAIVEIKVQSRTNSTHNYATNFDKSKSLSRQISFDCNNSNKSFEKNLKRPNSNHTFVNINLCKDKENSSVVYINRGKRHDSSKENSCINFRNNIDNNNINNIKISCLDLSPKNKGYSMGKNLNKLNKVNSDLNKNNDINNSNNSNNHIIYTSYNLKNRKTEHLNNSNSINSNMISNEEDNENFNIYVNKIKYFDNGKYEGIMLNNKREIKGLMIYNNGAKYEGQWRNDKKNGKGIFISSHYFDCKNKVGMKYEGEFKDDKLDGFGIGIYSNGDKYKGEWKNNKQYGRGIVEYMGGSKYEGEWVNGKFEGIGIFYLKNGERFEGRFSESKYNGYGKYFYINGDYLEGIFNNDRPTGNCLLHKVDGTITQVVHP
jgi:hypothetical protein